MKDRIQVAMIIQSYWPRIGGAERQLASLAPLLKARGVDIQVITRRYTGMAAYEIVDEVPVHRLPAPRPKALASAVFTAAALRLLKRQRPDLLHAHELLSPTTAGIAAKRLFGIPLVVKVLRGGELGDIAKLKRRPTGRMRLALMHKLVDRFLVISREIEAELAEVGIPPERCLHLPNGVDSAHFTPVGPEAKQTTRTKLGLPEAPTAVYTGRLTPEKHLERLIGLWPAVRGAQPGAHLLIVGSGEQEAHLREIAGSGVGFTGAVEDVRPYLQAADLFVLPSSTEGLSNALLEAMAAGLAVVATAVGGAPDVITHGENGWLVPPDEEPALEEAIITLLENPVLREQLGEQARQRVMSQYSLPEVAERLRALYGEVLASVPARAQG